MIKSFQIFRAIWLVLALPALLSANIPQGYYDSAEGKLGQELKDALNEIISGHTRIRYSWEPFFDLDEDPDNPDNVILIYSGFSVPKLPTNTHWNREHIWPRSRGLGTSGIAHDDLFNLTPCNQGVNSARGNLAFGYPNPEGSSYRAAGFYVNAPLAERDSRRWLPPDFDKGFIARAMFYMATRYAGNGGEPDLHLTNDPPNASPWGTEMGDLDAFLDWNRYFGPDAAEVRRNNRIFTEFQRNRNPYIDYPDLVDAVFTSDQYMAPGTWRVANFTFAELDDPTVSAWDADPDGDGFINLLEYAFGGDPFKPAIEAPVRIEQDGGQLSVTFRKVRDAAEWGMTYTVEISTDLITWVAHDGEVLSKVEDGWYWQKRIAVELAERRFVRVRVVVP